MTTENTTAQKAEARITADYRQGQFDRVNKNITEYRPKIKICGADGISTNHMLITADELTAIEKLLTKKIYTFDELPEEIQQKAIEKHADINVDFDWWDHLYEDAKTVLLKIDGFDLDHNRHCTGNFIESANDTAILIFNEHGKDCETYKTAENYQSEISALWAKLPEDPADDGCDDNEYEREKLEEEIDTEFLRSLLEDYSIMLQKDYEYMTSEKAIIETIKANDYDFTEDGEID